MNFRLPPGAVRAVLLALLVVGFGCTTERIPPGQCEFDRDCAAGQHCADRYCRNQCATDADCPNGRCVAADTPGARACRPNVTGAASCVRDGDCERGLACFDGRCLAQCRSNYDCQVVNPSSTCESGRCVARCAALRGDCDNAPANGCETDLRTAVPHCGACGRACPATVNGAPRCDNGACAVTCNAAFGNCDAVPVNGCEAPLMTDRTNCGACGRACPAGMVCSGGACGATCAAPGEQRCGESCVDVQGDVMNCGACGNACPAPARGAAVCVAGRCGVTCNPGFADCDMSPANGCEADLSSAESCGACGNRCGAATPRCAAADGGFACTTEACPFATCSGACVDTQSDANHCGACGNRCPSGPGSEARCEAGRCLLRCTDPARTGDCDGMPATGCEAALPTNASHCGACGNACPTGPNAAPSCAMGACGLTCSANFDNCDGVSANGCEVDTRANATHCGRCGNACSAPANARATCAAGACGFTCEPGFADCDGMAANGCEVNTATDRAHCGACRAACAGAQVCSAGRCGTVCGAGEMNCSGSCANLATSTAHCGACDRACATPANATAACTTGRCGFTCLTNFGDCDGNAANGCETSLLTTPTSCGRCGVTCALANATAGCNMGACVVARCDAGFADCNGNPADGCEVDTRGDRGNCGACGRACSLTNATPACVAGACAVATCNAGFADCDRAAANGCEVDTRVHTAHCGGCGSACSAVGGTPACAAGACSIVCAAGRGNCDLSAANGCEVDVRTTVAHCGACGRACMPANATPACAAGACGYTTCNAGFADCDMNAANGCEVDVRTTVAHCGGCGRTCAPANAAASCAAGACGYTTCNAGFADCDGNRANGCEVDTRTTVAHCGACGRTCAPANATPACAAGACGYGACSAGFADCDGSRANGCEVDTRTSNAHCGGCGRACPTGQVCSAGVCTLVCGAGLTNCGGACVNTASDPAHCGMCGRACATPANAARTCAAGACGFACVAGFGDCDAMATNGCEANLQTALAHCGACGRACAPANATASCAAGVCGYTTCNAGFADCDGNRANGCEVNLNTSPSNCGRCGAACAPANATPACAAGACGYGACNAGFGDCDMNRANGCEVDVRTTVAHCGGCGMACSANNGAPSCAGGSCSIVCASTGAASTDPPGFLYRTRFGDCDGNARSNGCETSLLTTAACHACGRACTFPNASPACNPHSATQCVIASCNAGFADCNGVQADGCEVNTASDNNNCGACGRPCIRGAVCRQSACRPANDACSGATPINLAAGRQQWLSGNTSLALHDINSSCQPGSTSPDLYFSFTLTQRELVYADTFGDGTAAHPLPTYDTLLFFANGCTTSMPATGPAGMVYCNDDAVSVGCAGDSNRSQVVAVLDPGTYYLVQAGYGGNFGSASINFQHLPMGNLPATYVGTMGVGSFYTFRGTTSGTGVVAPSAACSANGPETSFWWRHCSGNGRYAMTASTCNAGSNFDTVVYYRTPYIPNDVCNDDQGTGCTTGGTLSTISSQISGLAGIHVVTVDGYGGGSAGNYVFTLGGYSIITGIDPERGVCRPRHPRLPPPPRRMRAGRDPAERLAL